LRSKIVACVVVLALGAGMGAVAGLWWSNSTSESICQRIEADCGDDAMSMDDCLVGRQQDLLTYGVSAMRRVKTCLAAAPHDCVSATACIGAAEDGR
jgi:hypothetical protein